MKLSEILNHINQIAVDKGISMPFCCGGIPRDRMIKNPHPISDIDLTTGDQTIHHLAKEISIAFQGPETKYITMPDGHSRVYLGKLKLDFSSNFIIPGISIILKHRGIQNPSLLEQEMNSRDFTCNALLMSMDLKTITDPTGRGVKDIENKVLETCLLPSITLATDHKRIVRIIYLAAKLGFEPSERIVEWVKKHPAAFSSVPANYLTKKLNKAINYNLDTTVRLLDQMNLFPYTPPLPPLIPYLTK